MRARGVDISSCQRAIDFGALRAGGFEFVIEKATEGTYADSTFVSRIRAARDAGVLVPLAYHVLGFGSPIAAQVENAIANILYWDVDVMLDFETPAPADWAAHGITGQSLCARALAFTQGIIAAGRRVVVYTYPDYYRHLPDCPELRELAALTGSAPAHYPHEKIEPSDRELPWVPAAWGNRWTVWQWSGNAGTDAPGVPQVVDHDLWNGSREDLINWMTGSKVESFSNPQSGS